MKKAEAQKGIRMQKGQGPKTNKNAKRPSARKGLECKMAKALDTKKAKPKTKKH
jgi:hypothetical protein